MPVWLIEQSVLDRMENAPSISPETIERIMATSPLMQDGPNPMGRHERVMTIVGNVAQINLVGIMTSSPDFFAMLFGGGNVLYGDLIAAIRAAEADPAVESVEFYTDSPGGEAQPAIGFWDAIRDMKKPTRALVVNAHSAAYGAVTQCDTIVANTRASTVGSIGAVASFRKPSESFMIDVTSTDAPNKRPDPETESGQRVIREQRLDPFHSMFAEAVATGRGVTVDDVNKNFGQGGIVFAEKALEIGMIDQIIDAPTQSVAPSDDNQPNAQDDTTGVLTMDLETLKAEHPGVYAQAAEEGRKEERNRVSFHANMGLKNGAEAFALKACQDGTEMNDGTALSEYMSAGMNKRELTERQNEETELSDLEPAPVDDETVQKANVTKMFAGAGFNVNL